MDQAMQTSNQTEAERFLALPDNLRRCLLMLAQERLRQDAKWGGPQHDDTHSTGDFVKLVQDYAGWARVMAGMGSADKAQRRMLQVSALALADVERTMRFFDRMRGEGGASSAPAGDGTSDDALAVGVAVGAQRDLPHSEAMHTANTALAAAGLPTYDEARETLAVLLGLMVGNADVEELKQKPLWLAAIKSAERITSA